MPQILTDLACLLVLVPLPLWPLGKHVSWVVLEALVGLSREVYVMYLLCCSTAKDEVLSSCVCDLEPCFLACLI